MPLSITMLTRNEFVPEHDEHYVAFLVSDFYGDLELKYLRCEFQYGMIDADNGYPLPCGVCYYGDDMPFDTPLLFDADHKAYVLTPEQIEERKYHPDPEQRFWWEKTWFLTDKGNFQLHPEELDEMSIGIMKEKDFMKQVVEANADRRKIKEAGR